MKALENLVNAKQLQQEPPDAKEIAGMVGSAEFYVKDSLASGLSDNSHFTLAYNAVHSLSLAALRFYGYRPVNRFIVFQCLQHTLGWNAAQWRVLDQCHKRRNLIEYEGQYDIDGQLLKELDAAAEKLLVDVKTLIESNKSW